MNWKIFALLLMVSAASMASEPIPVADSTMVASSPATVADVIDDVPELPPIPEQSEQKEVTKMKFLIKKLSVPHCKRGPERCEICRKSGEPRWCLLDVDPPDQEMVQRPVIEFVLNGERQFLVYDVIRSFASEEEARSFLSKADYPGLIWDK